MLRKFIKNVDYYNNNIYFRCDVTQKSIMQLTRIITLFKTNTKNINIHITSNGGDLEYGMMCYDLLKLSKIPIHTFCEGYVCSSGTLIFLAGQKRFMTNYSKILIHQLTSEIDGTHENIKDHLYNNNLVMNDLKQLYLMETNIDKNTLNNLLKKNIFLTSQECLKYGFINKIL